MSNSFNTVVTLGRDAEIRQLSNGKQILTFNGATNTGWGDRKKTLWIRCSVFGNQANEQLAGFLKKGVQAAVSGELTTSEYESNGQTKTSLELTTVFVDLVGGRRESQPAEPARQAEPAGADYDDDIPF
jgi:single-strand DNA-binding protein